MPFNLLRVGLMNCCICPMYVVWVAHTTILTWGWGKDGLGYEGKEPKRLFREQIMRLFSTNGLLQEFWG